MILKILPSLENPYANGPRVRVWEVQIRCLIGNPRVSLSAWEWSDFSTTMIGKADKGRVEVNVKGEKNCHKRGMGLIKKAGGPGRLGCRWEWGRGAGCYSLSAREWSGFRMPFALSFCRRVPAVNCLTRYTDKE